MFEVIILDNTSNDAVIKELIEQKQTGHLSYTFTAPTTGSYTLSFLTYEKAQGTFTLDNIEILDVTGLDIAQVLQNSQEMPIFVPSVLSFSDYYPFGMMMPGRHTKSNFYRYGFQGQERDDEVKGLANHMSFKNYGYDPRIGRRWQVDPEIKRGPQFSPFIFTFDNPTNFVDENGKWAYWSHYKMTKKALIKAGFSKATAKEIAYYASTYADDPKLVPQILGVVVGLFNFIAPSQFVKNEKKYQNSEMSYSQKDYTKGVAIHAMRGWDEDITEEEAVHRALYGGVFTDEKGKKHKIEGAYNVLKRLAGIDEKDLTQDQKKEIGVAIHTIQDAEAHKGGRWIHEHKKQAKAKGRKKRHSTWRDLFGNKSKAKAATKKAVDILKGN